MIRPLFCGMEDCTPVVRKGTHGFMKSIEKDLPRDFELNPSNMLKQKISLKHIVNRPSKYPTTDRVKNQANHCQLARNNKIISPSETNKFRLSDQQRPRANNAISQSGQLQQNRRNLICLKNNLNLQINRNKIQHDQEEKMPIVTRIIQKNLQVQNLQRTPGKGTNSIFYHHSKNPINFIKNFQFQPVATSLVNHKNRQFHQVNHQDPHKENLQQIHSIERKDSIFKIRKQQPINEVLKHQIPINSQGNLLTPLKSFKVIRKTQIFQSVNSVQQRNQQNQQILYLPNLSRPNLIGSSGMINISKVKENHYVPQRKIKESEKRSKFQPQKPAFKKSPQNLLFQPQYQKSKSFSPFKQIAMILQTNSQQKLTLEVSKRANQETITRQNSKLSINPSQNPKNSIMTFMTNESHFQEYQNHKQFENRFNRSRLFDTNHFGVHSYLQHIHTSQTSQEHNFLNSQIQMKHTKSIEDEASQLEQQQLEKYQNLMREKNQKKNIDRNISQRISLEFREINSSVEIKDNKNQLSIDCQEVNEEAINTQVIKKKESNKIQCHKKNRSSFFQAIENSKNRSNQTKTKTSNFTNTAKSDSNGQELKQLSMFNMKDAESFVESEGNISDDDSELEFVVHSCSNVKLKSFALLNSMHAVKYDCNKKDKN